ncbi:hypothetical protein Y032_0323g2507 [Ancylostoma ceylanicum]|uniref:Uncharacterized protein n=1 Tax=Ancylostoma ceylanicum TaxID=53326 RepID=A0A016S0W5_9BILA|nr:hypothetical protein Y032_0323g2507 [Ancylostoma ceylanicum]
MILDRYTVEGALFATFFFNFFEFSPRANSSANPNSLESEIFSIESNVDTSFSSVHIFEMPLKRSVHN